MLEAIKTAAVVAICFLCCAIGTVSTTAQLKTECDRHGSVQLDGKRYECKRASTQEGASHE